MNHRIICRILSRVSLTEALLLAISALVAMLYGDPFLIPFGVPIALLVLLGLLLGLVKTDNRDFFAREGFLSVALSWIYMSIFGALPFFLSGAIPSYIDSIFETVSGFTTTGATLLPDVDSMPYGLLFWRSFTHWIGGMGVLVFLIAVMPLAGNRSMHLMRAESPGPSVGKLTPRLRSTSTILYGIYLGMTILLFVLLLLGGMPVFDSITTAFSTAGTGGFSVKDAGIIEYNSVYIEIVLTIFTLLFGVNFNVFFLFLLKRPLQAIKSEELWWYLGIFAGATLLVTVNILPLADGFGHALRLAAFQNASLMSSTGFASTDFSIWPEFSLSVMIVLMVIGACAGSTGGGFKVSRVVILAKAIRREVSRMIHPRVVSHIKFDRKTLDAETTHGVLVYLAVYVMLTVIGILVVAADGFDHVTTVTAVISCLNNVGPGLSRIGPLDNFSIFSPAIKLALSMLMLFGRLEIFPLLLMLTPAVWRRK